VVGDEAAEALGVWWVFQEAKFLNVQGRMATRRKQEVAVQDGPYFAQ
jgi:hypothetical protein